MMGFDLKNSVRDWSRPSSIPDDCPSNVRILVSRNEREGWYFKRLLRFNPKFGRVERFYPRTWSKPAALRYKHSKFGKVNFAELGIKLSTIEEALDGQP